MQIRADIQLVSLIKAMEEVVIPAVDPENRLAVEQSRLVFATLQLMQKQIPLQFRFDRDELTRLVSYAGALAAIESHNEGVSEAVANLSSAAGIAQKLLDRCSVDPAALVGAIRNLRMEIGSLVELAMAENDLHNMSVVEKAVLDLSREQLLRDRAFVASQGYEVDPGKLPKIEVLLS